MRLLNAKALVSDGKWELKEFPFGDPEHFAPPYAVLSHTWGPKGEEILLEDIEGSEEPDTSLKKKSGFAKVHGVCAQAIKREIDWVWIDTCCISRVDDVEQFEAVNSMYTWLRQAVVCYVHLSDVPSAEDPAAEGSAFRQSRWFKRAWALPELLAPHAVWFFSASWDVIGVKTQFVSGFPTESKSSGEQYPRLLTVPIGEITDIHDRFLKDPSKVYDSSVAERISWAAGREATREEDRAYSLMGLFDIRLPIEYGVGLRTAFRRLQEEIIKRSTDPSILAWGVDSPLEALSLPSPDPSGPSYLAPSPDAFGGIRWSTYFRRRIARGFPVINKENHVQVRATSLGGESYPYFLGLLECQAPKGDPNVIAFLLRVETTPGRPPMAYRVRGSASFTLTPHISASWDWQGLTQVAQFIRLSADPRPVHQLPSLELPGRQQLLDTQIDTRGLYPAGKYQFLDCFPPFEAYDDPPPDYDSTQMLLRFLAPFDDTTDTGDAIDEHTDDSSEDTDDTTGTDDPIYEDIDAPTVLWIRLKKGATPQMALTKLEGTAVEILRERETNIPFTLQVCFDYLDLIANWRDVKPAISGRPSLELEGLPPRGN